MSPKRTLTGIIRERLDSIESRLEFGVRHETIVSELQVEGYDTTLASFRNLLAKARKWRAENGSKSVRQQPASRLLEPRRSAGITKPETAAINGRIRNPGNIDESELY